MNNLNNNDRSEIIKASNILIAANDCRFNYQFIKNQDDIDNFDVSPMIVTMNQYDYSIKRDEGSDLMMPSLCPLSLVSSKDNLDDVEAFYASKFPRLPAEYHGILARYSTGRNLTKKEIRNSLKKSKKKGCCLPVGLEIARGKIQVDFD